MQFHSILIVLISIMSLYIFLNIFFTVWLRHINPLHKLSQADKTIYLTFDDGIDKKYTPALLDLLDQHQITCTFFILGSTLKNNADIVQKMQKSGHTIALHSYQHKNAILQPPYYTTSDFKRSMEAFYNCNVTPKFYRPPWGHINILTPYYCNKYKLTMVLWNIIAQDWKQDTSAEIICNKLQSRLRGNAVICLHDGRGKNHAPMKTIEALGTLLPLWKKEGYRFETIDTLYKKSNS